MWPALRPSSTASAKASLAAASSPVVRSASPKQMAAKVRCGVSSVGRTDRDCRASSTARGASPRRRAPGPDGRRTTPQELTFLLVGGSVAGRSLGLLQEGFDVAWPVADCQGQGVLDEQPGPAALRPSRQRLKPTEHSGDLAAAGPDLLDPSLDQPRRKLVVRGGEGVVYRLGEQSVVLVPTRGAEVQLSHEPRLFASEALAEKVGEEVMVAVPPTLIVERHHEEVLPLESLQHNLSVAATCQCVAQRSRHASQHRGREQEIPHDYRLARKDLIGQEVQHVAVAAGEGLDETGGVQTVAHRERG